jgi:hypothetical protein
MLASVVCVGLGGTKIEIGLLTGDQRFFSSGEILWRSRPEFTGHYDAVDIVGFCDKLASLADALLRTNGFSWANIGVVGVPFPGPQSGKLWYSNNLTRAFLDGAPLEEALAAAIRRITQGGPVPEVRVVLDAKCDAGGELYHPDGKLYREPPLRASVFNVATGIAAGLIYGGGVLLSNEDFRTHVGARYDSGAGQLGRHLWYDPFCSRWSYHYRAEGLTPEVAPPAIRMTDYLSGPAVAGRLLHRLGDAGLLSNVSVDQTAAALTLEKIYRQSRRDGPEESNLRSAIALRSAPAVLATSLLSWLDAAYAATLGQEMHAVAEALVGEVITDFAGALRAWLADLDWRHWVGPIVFTGGFGLRFIAQSDGDPERSFCRRLQRLMPPDTIICRSHLHHGTLREAYLFQRQRI